MARKVQKRRRAPKKRYTVGDLTEMITTLERDLPNDEWRATSEKIGKIETELLRRAEYHLRKEGGFRPRRSRARQIRKGTYRGQS